MPKFTDSKGREHNVVITLGTVRRLRPTIDLGRLFTGDGKVFAALNDPFIFADVLYKVVQPEISEEEFFDVLSGDSLNQAMSAFIDAVVDLYPNSKSREVIRQTLAKANAAQDRRFDEAAEKIKTLDVDKIVSKLMGVQQ